MDADYIRRLTVQAIALDDELMESMVLKGGNLLSLVYKLTDRASEDLDYSMANMLATPAELEVHQEKMEQALKSRFNDEGMVVFDFTMEEKPRKISDKLKRFWGGYLVNFKVIDKTTYNKFEGDIDSIRRNAVTIGKNQSTKLKIDISNHEYIEAASHMDGGIPKLVEIDVTHF